jgi:cytoskeletal protein RodZ
MKRCPECYETYDDRDRFCEIDGHELLINPTLVTNDEERVVPHLATSRQGKFSWPTAVIGMIIGMIIGTGVYAVYSYSFDQSKPNKQSQSPVYVSDVREPVQVRRPAPEPNSEVTPEESPSPEPEAEASPQPVVTAATESHAALRLNQGPISTGEKTKNDVGKGVTIIQMNDGSIVEVDAAWEDKQGVWYRRGGLVSFVESARVKAITERIEPKPSNQ